METYPRVELFGVDSSPVRVMYRFPQTDLGLHTHDFVELVVIVAGRARHWNGREERVVGPGDVLLIPPEAAHGYRRCAGCVLHNVLVERRTFERWRARLSFGTDHLAPRVRGRAETGPWLRLGDAQLAEIEAGLISATVELGRGDECGRFVAEAKICEMVGRLTRQKAQGLVVGGAGETPRVRRLLHFVEEHLGAPFSLDEWARATGVSPRTLDRLVRRELGVAPGAYVRRRRLARATQYLRESERSVTEVAFACGFTDSNYFARAFRREHGRSPRAWRERVCRTPRA